MSGMTWRRLSALILLANASLGQSASEPRSKQPVASEPRLLVVALDAVPYDVVAEAAGAQLESPLFDELAGPVHALAIKADAPA